MHETVITKQKGSADIASYLVQLRAYLAQLGIGRRHLTYAIGAAIAFLVLVPIFTYIYFAADLESKETIMNRNDTGVILLDEEGEPFFTFFEAKQKTNVPLSQIPDHMQKAVIAMEDKQFYDHPGFSIRGIARAVVVNARNAEIVQGGSTITQQLVKNALLSPKKNFLRKYQELVLAQEIERRFTKDQILEMYLNSVYFGEGAFGVEASAQAYFGKPAAQLSLSESTLLVALLKAPSALSPLNGNGEVARERQKLVLAEMVSQGYISKQEAEAAFANQLTYRTKEDITNKVAPHFALMVIDELKTRYGEEKIARSGFTVKTTLNLSWQQYAEEVLRNQVNRLRRRGVSNGAAVAIDPKTGAVKVLVGSKNWFNDEFGKFNVATASRQPGSSFKPIVYAKALEEGLITPATVLHDTPTAYPGGYAPENYDNQFRGEVLARRALANSLNVASVEVMNKVGVHKTIEMAQRLGITTLENPSDYGLSLVLGAGEVKPIELTNAYATFANKGVKNDVFLISEIKDKMGETIYTNKPNQKKVLSEEVAFLVSSILSDNNARSEIFGNSLTISRPAAAKTGTTQNFRDAWTLGYTPSLAVGVWIGNNDNTQMNSVAGSLGAAPIWRLLMERFLAGTTVERFTPPSGVYATWICTYNGLKLEDKTATSSAMREYFIKGAGPTGVCVPPTPTPEPISEEDKNEEGKNDEKEENKEKSNGEGEQPKNEEQKNENPTNQQQNQIHLELQPL